MKKVRYYIALFVSRLFDPIVLFSFLFFYLLFFQIGVESEDFFKTMGLVLAEVVICVGYLFYLIRKKKIDYDITDKEKRPLFLVPVVLFLVLIMPVFWYLKIDRLFLFLQVLAIIFILVWLVINRYYKISGHVGSLTIVVFLMVRIFDWPSGLFFLVLLLAWSRIELKKHSLGQTLLGFVVAWGLGEVLVRLGGY